MTASAADSRPLYLASWSGHANFGDELSRYIVSRLSKRPLIVQEQPVKGGLCAIGSILKESDLYAGVYIWGSGCLDPQKFKSRSLHKLFPLIKGFKGHLYRAWGSRFNRSVLTALRGPLTHQLVKDFGFTHELVYGDPGILLPKFYQPKAHERCELGIILHHTQQNLPVKQSSKVKLISISRTSDPEIEAFADEVASCRQILTSSLHGLIVAQAYGIPARSFSIKNKPIHGSPNFKFADYLLGTGQEVMEPLLLDGKELLSPAELMGAIPHKSPNLTAAADRLLQAFPPELA